MIHNVTPKVSMSIDLQGVALIWMSSQQINPTVAMGKNPFN